MSDTERLKHFQDEWLCMICQKRRELVTAANRWRSASEEESRDDRVDQYGSRQNSQHGWNEGQQPEQPTNKTVRFTLIVLLELAT